MTKRLAIIHKDRCNPESCGVYKCIKYCPINRKGENCIYKAEGQKAGIDEPLCIGCGICSNTCPFNAIDIINLPQALEKDPIHRYGKNMFELFSLPIPIFGKTVGTLGINGIGKSTAFKILAGILNPNLGNLEKDASTEEIIDRFKGTEAHLFFEKVNKGEIKVSYKPQNVDLIPKTTKGKVRQLLEKVDEQNKLNEIAEKLELTKFLDHNIKDISGGELQRVAIAATLLKKANLYIFDEPTSYLDIKQRLKITNILRELPDDNTSVLVIEHDLVALDYMTDLIHIMYGKQACFGVAAHPRATKEAINTFLEGFLKEENVRFRDSEIKFEIKPPDTKKHIHKLTSWPELTKKFEAFTLKTDPGEVYRGEVVGILGENGIGKTTFVKLLAGVIKPDSGEIDTEVTVSYKPQYLESDSDEVVASMLGDKYEKHKNDVMDPLSIEPLLTKPLNTLSGGELQRVSIAKALSQDTHLILLDEPSAYLDIEMRLLLSKIIANIAYAHNKTILVVDHDILFLDYISDRLLVFSGEPAKNGIVQGPFAMEKGMNSLLKDVNITLRRDSLSGRPRINKPDSVKDQEQKKSGKYYYA